MVMKELMCYLALVITAGMMFGSWAEIVEAECLEAQAVDPADFAAPQDNAYFPKAIGTTYLYMAETEDELIRNEITITSDTKEIMGVDCIVVYDVEWVSVDGGIIWFITEQTYDWYAWDNEGNVWYFGEWTTEFEYDENWIPTGQNHDGSWEAGVNDAMPGIVMLANPVTGVCYQQEFYEDEAEDMAKVLRLNATVSVEYGDFDDCLKTKEWTPLDPGVVEHKYYAPGVGLVFIEELKGKTVLVELVDVH